MSKVIRVSDKTLDLLNKYRELKVKQFNSEPYNAPELSALYSRIGEDQLIWEALYQLTLNV